MQEQPKPTGMNLGDKIPKEHVPLLLNSIVNEALMGFKRDLVNGEWQWTGTGADGQVTHELFNFVEDDHLALEMLTRFGQGQTPPIAWQLNYIPHIEGLNDRAMYQIYLLAPDANKQPQIVQNVGANRIGLGIALALCGLVQADLMVQHRTLFPGHYMRLQ